MDRGEHGCCSGAEAGVAKMGQHPHTNCGLGSLSSTTSTHPIIYHIRPTFHFTVHSRLMRHPHICILVPQSYFTDVDNFHFIDWDAEPISPVNFMEKEICMTCLQALESRSPSEPNTCIQRFMDHSFRQEIHFVSIIAKSRMITGIST